MEEVEFNNSVVSLHPFFIDTLEHLTALKEPYVVGGLINWKLCFLGISLMNETFLIIGQVFIGLPISYFCGSIFGFI